MRKLSLRRERDRLLVSVAAAVLVHGVIFVVVPFSGLAERDRLEPPMYVALDPLPPDPAEELAEPEPEETAEPDPEPDLEPDPEPEPEPEPTPESQPEPDPEPEPAPELQSEPDPEPATEPESAPEPDPEPEPEPAPEEPRAPEPDTASDEDSAPPAEPTPEESPPAPSGPAFVETPPPPPPPPRERQFSDVRSDFGGQDSQPDSGFVDAQISSLYDWQSEHSDALEAWEERQEERRSRTTTEEPADDRSAASDNTLAQRLTDLIEGIRTSSSNVVDSDDPPRRDRDQSDDSSGDGSGIVVEDGSGTRRRTEGAAVDLSSVSLGSGFPPEYPVRVRFQVNAAGTVISARVQPPTPDPDLNRAIEAAVERWRFESAADRRSAPVEGSVTIIVQTR